MNLSARLLAVFCLALSVAYVLPAAAGPIVLYDDNNTLHPLPADQGWLLYFADTGGSADQTAVAGTGVRLTTDDGVKGGYTNYGGSNQPSFPILDRDLGFRLEFELNLELESHSSNDRAGFSVILLSEDLRGIELGFWNNEVWAQNDDQDPDGLFTHGEGNKGFSPQGQEYAYQLTILGDGYTLSADGIEVINGSLRNYAAASTNPIYSLPNYLFLGDDTTRGAATSVLGKVSIEVFPAAVPLPSGLWLVGLGLALLAGRSATTKRQRRTSHRLVNQSSL